MNIFTSLYRMSVCVKLIEKERDVRIYLIIKDIPRVFSTFFARIMAHSTKQVEWTE